MIFAYAIFAAWFVVTVTCWFRGLPCNLLLFGWLCDALEWSSGYLNRLAGGIRAGCDQFEVMRESWIAERNAQEAGE